MLMVVRTSVPTSENILTTGLKFHPFFQSAYSGGGFTVGAGYRTYVGPYSSLDVRGSITPTGYKRIEGEFLADRLIPFGAANRRRLQRVRARTAKPLEFGKQRSDVVTADAVGVEQRDGILHGEARSRPDGRMPGA